MQLNGKGSQHQGPHKSHATVISFLFLFAVYILAPVLSVWNSNELQKALWCSFNHVSFNPLMYLDLGKQKINSSLSVISVAVKMLAEGKVPGASVRNSAHGKGHEEGGLAYAKAWSSLRKPPVPKHLTPKPESVLCSHLHLWPYGGLSPITVSLGEGVNMQLQGNKNSWAWQECFSLWTLLKVI